MQLANLLTLTQIDRKGEITENAYTRPFEAKPGRKVVGRSLDGKRATRSTETSPNLKTAIRRR